MRSLRRCHMMMVELLPRGISQRRLTQNLLWDTIVSSRLSRMTICRENVAPMIPFLLIFIIPLHHMAQPLSYFPTTG